MPTFERTITIQFQAFQYDAEKTYDPRQVESYSVWKSLEEHLPSFDVYDVAIEEVSPYTESDGDFPVIKVMSVTRRYYDAFGVRNNEVYKLKDKQWLVEVEDRDYEVMSNEDFLKFIQQV